MPYPEMLFIGGMFVLAFGAGFILLVCVMISRWRTVSPIKKLHYITILFLFIGALNFLCGVAIVETGFMGGTALHGKIEGGQFYLGEGGEYVSVSSSTFLICKYYEITVLLLTFIIVPKVVGL